MIRYDKENVMKINLKKYDPTDQETEFPLSEKKAKKAWKIILSSKSFNQAVSKARKALKLPINGLSEKSLHFGMKKKALNL